MRISRKEVPKNVLNKSFIVLRGKYNKIINLIEIINLIKMVDIYDKKHKIINCMLNTIVM